MKVGQLETVIVLFLIFYEAAKAETSCEKQRRDVLLARRSTRGVRQYLPRCTTSGMYKPLQCDAELCWCVNDSGERVSNAMPVKRAGSMSCSSMKRKRGMSACEIKLEAANNMAVGSVGVFYPQCNPDGTYQAMQCNQSTGWCWCVDINTGEQLDWETRDKSTLACE